MNNRKYPLRLPEATAARLMALLTGLVGVLGIVSALTPQIPGRASVLRELYPPGVASAARDIVLIASLCLVWLSLALARRRHRAWQVALALVVITTAGHLAKGLDLEESIASTLLLAGLVRYRSQFDVPGEGNRARLVRATLAAAAAIGVWGALKTDIIPGPAKIDRAAGAFAVAVFLRALYLWLRPLGERVRESSIERRMAQDIVADHGTESLDAFALRRDKNYFFSPSRRSFLAYRVVAGAALVSGDPIGHAEEFPDLLAEFQRVAKTQGWRLAILGASTDIAPVYRTMGLHPITLGEEAVVDPKRFSLHGRPIRKVRQSVTRLTKAGHRVVVVDATMLSPALRGEIEAVSRAWLGNAPERGFTMSMDDLFGHPQLRFALAMTADERVAGFLHLVESADGKCLSLSSMRRMPETVNGLNEFLIAETILWAKANGLDEVSLNFCVFKHLLEDDITRLPHRALRVVIRSLDRIFQIDRLLAFNKKFFPEWRPRYVFLERRSDMFLVAMAYMHLESLLVPPMPKRAGDRAVSAETRSV